MPNISNITVTAGGTSRTLQALVPSSGDNVAAQWRDTSGSAGTGVSQRVQVSCTSKWNTKRTARKIDIRFIIPVAVLETTTSNIAVTKAVALANVSIVLPTTVPTNETDKLAQYIAGFLSNSDIQAVIQSGFAPT